jgi:hypothetical protein
MGAPHKGYGVHFMLQRIQPLSPTDSVELITDPPTTSPRKVWVSRQKDKQSNLRMFEDIGIPTCGFQMAATAMFNSFFILLFAL